MSEYIDNSTKRKEIIKGIIKQLHAGKNVDEVKPQFEKLLQTATASEIAEVEQMLINEGLAVSEVQRLCDVHVAVFRDALDEQAPPETTPGHPIHTFLAENRAAEKSMADFEQTLKAYTQAQNSATLSALQIQLQSLREYDAHYLRKENLLFSYLEKYNFMGPTQVMWGIHDKIRANWKALAKLLETQPAPEEVVAIFKEIKRETQEMIYKEEKILYPTAIGYLNHNDWATMLAQEDEIGYSYVKPGEEWRQRFAEKEQAETPDMAQVIQDAGLINLKTGFLQHEQLNLILQNLPIDITFVDENDEVKFFSETKDRIFPRSPAIIGRKVQHCHPPQSVDRVLQIVNDFKAGTRDEAEFWIRMNGRFIHIRYFAIRDQAGQYKGTLEVTQDIAPLRELEGERRILDEAPVK
jgi:DUF438 domain-containing protein